MKRGVIIGVGIIAVIGVVFLILNLTKSKGPSNSSITVWIPFNEAQTYQDISAAYLKKNPSVTLNVKYIKATDSQDYEAQVVNAIANGTGPDVWMVRSDWIQKHLDKSAPATGTTKTSDPAAIIKNTIIPNIADKNIVNNKLYGVPMSSDSLAVIYNADYYNTLAPQATPIQKAALTKLAATWSDLSLQVAGISRSTGTAITHSGIALGTSDNTFAAGDVLDAFLVQNGVSVLTTDQKDVAFNLANTNAAGVSTFPATSALAYYASFAQPGSATYSWNSTVGDPITAFLQQRTGALIGYYSTLKQIQAQSPKFSIQMAPLPQPTATSNRVDYGVSWSLIVNKNSKNVNADWAYLSYLATKDPMVAYEQATGKIAPYLSNSQPSTPTSIVGVSQALSLYRNQLYTVKQLDKPEWQKTDQIILNTINLVVNSGQQPQTAVDTAAEQFKAFLN